MTVADAITSVLRYAGSAFFVAFFMVQSSHCQTDALPAVDFKLHHYQRFPAA
jgi:hypothetical protein